MSFQDLVKIDIYRRRKVRGAGFQFQHLTSAHIPGLTGMLDQAKACSSFQNNDSAIAQDRRFEDERRAGNADRHRVRSEFAAAGILGHIN